MRISICLVCRKRRAVDRESASCSSCAPHGEEWKAAAEELEAIDRGRTQALVRVVREPRVRMQSQINNRLQIRIQMLNDFLTTYYPAVSSAYQIPSWLSSLPVLDLSPPLLGSAVDTLGLAHIGTKNHDQKMLQEARKLYSQVLSLMIRRIADPSRKVSEHGHRNVVMSALLAGVCEDFVIGRPSGINDGSTSKHMLGVHQYLTAIGPGGLDLDNSLEYKIVQNVQVGCLFLSLAWRKTFSLGTPTWTGPLPPTAVPIGNGMGTWYPLVVPLPGLLEKVDQLLSQKRPKWDELAKVFVGLEDVNGRVMKWLQHEAPLCDTPLQTVPITDADAFDMTVEEHCFITSFTNPPILVYYNFVDANHAMRYATSWLVSLLINCTSLRILNRRPSRKHFPKAKEVAREKMAEAFRTAQDLCKCAYFYGMVKSLGHGYFMGVLLQSAKVFFEEHGAYQEVNWCQCCIIALNLRLKRLEDEGYLSLCKVGALRDELAKGLLHRKGKTNFFPKGSQSCPLKSHAQ